MLLDPLDATHPVRAWTWISWCTVRRDSRNRRQEHRRERGGRSWRLELGSFAAGLFRQRELESSHQVLKPRVVVQRSQLWLHPDPWKESVR